MSEKLNEIVKEIKSLSAENRTKIALELYKNEPIETILSIAPYRAYEKMKHHNATDMTLSVDGSDPETREKFTMKIKYELNS